MPETLRPLIEHVREVCNQYSKEFRMPDPNRHQLIQSVATQDLATLQLVPPLADEFSVNGGRATVERARNWALSHRYQLAANVASCAHGLYLLPMCPHSSGCDTFGQLDHSNLWVPASMDYGERPFLLAHPYTRVIEAETRLYAEAHGLVLATDRWSDDDWYGPGTLPIRMEVPEGWPLWPIERAAIELLHTHPVNWPEETD